MSQTAKLYDLLKDGNAHSTLEIMEKVYGSDHLGLAATTSRIADLRKQGHNIPRATRDKDHSSVYWYKMILPEEILESGLTRNQEKQAKLELYSILAQPDSMAHLRPDGRRK